MKKICTLLLLVVASIQAYSQGTLLWEKTIAIPSGQSMLSSVESHNKKYWVGIADIDTYMSPTIINSPTVTSAVIAYDSTGDTLWHRSLQSYFPDYNQGWGICRGKNYNYWAVVRFDWKVGLQTIGSGIGVVELDTNGQVLSVREFARVCYLIQQCSMTPTDDGGFLLSSHLYRSDTCWSNWDLFTLRVDGDGNQKWLNIYKLPDQENTRRFHGNIYPGNKYIMTYRTDSQRHVGFIDSETGIWLYSKPAPTVANLPNIRPLRDGRFVMFGEKAVGSNNGDPFMAVTDANFNILWQRTYTTLLPNKDSFAFVDETKDNAVVAICRDDNGGRQRTVLKIKLSNGDIEWQRTFSSAIEFASTTITSNGDYHIYGQNWGPRDYHVAMLQDVADFLQPSDYCTDSVRANFTGTWQQDTLRLRSTSNSGMAYQDSLNYQWLIEGSTVSLDSAVQQVKDAALYPNGLSVSLVITNFWGCKDTLTAKVMPDGTVVGNRPVETGHALSLRNAYPNPSTQNVAIGYTLPAKTENAVLRVYELGTGRTVAERHLSALDSEVKFNVSGWATGVYAYQLYVNGAPVAVKKMVVSR